MKILITTGLYPPDIGGPATYSKLLKDELPNHPSTSSGQDGIKVEILSFGEVRHLPKIISHIAYFFKVLAKGKDADIIYAQDAVSVGFPSAFASIFLRTKFVLKIVGDYAWEQYMNKNKKFEPLEDFQEEKYDYMTELRRKIERWVAKEADKIIVPSKYLESIVEMWNVKKDKINVVYNAFPSTSLRINISKEEARKNLKLDGMILISSGRLVPWKGFDVLIGVIPEVLREIPDAKLYIIGSGPEENNLKSQISNLKLDNNVFLTGQLSYEELLNYLIAGDIFVLNTGYEGFSHQILEAMAVGIPIITTNVGGNPEIIQNNENGILIDYNAEESLKSKIISLYKSELLREKFIENAKEKSKEFSKERMINETIKVLS